MPMPNLDAPPSAFSMPAAEPDEATWKTQSPAVNSAVDLPSRPP